MAKSLYNGVELPVLPEWDNGTFPHAYINESWVISGHYTLRMFKEPYVLDGSTRLANFICEDGETFLSCKATSESTSWGTVSENVTNSEDDTKELMRQKMVWANFDLVTEDGTTLLSASDPVPVESPPSNALTSSDGFALQDSNNLWLIPFGAEATTPTHDPTSMLLGWLTGERVKAMLRRKMEPVAYPEGCLTFASAEPFTIGVNNATKNWDGTLYYSTNTAVWSEWDGTTAIASSWHGGEQVVYMRGSGNTRIMPASSSFTKYNLILTGSDIRCIGNIENLLDYETVANGEHPVMANSCYERMFYGCTSLVIAPELPTVTLSESCYESMFEQCANLTEAPALPASTLNERCYYRMFTDCKSLETVPALPALEMKKECYMRMFNGCTKLKLSTTQSEEYPYEYRIPTSGNGTVANVLTPLYDTFGGTGGTFIGSPSINTTYYTANEVIH